MRHDKSSNKHNLIFLGGFAVFWVFIMLIMAGLGKGFQAYENRMLQKPFYSWWQGFSSPQHPELMKSPTIEIVLPEDNVEMLDINELRPFNALIPPMYSNMSYQSPGITETKWYNYIDMKPMKAIRFGRERDASGVQNDVHIVAMPGYFFK